ncbi:MAG TPA: hypothetical protein VHM70_12855 [Polyangiaceae bacterium]|jgi:hypothetical protein|nr:hypothetical protein [Polyangiaceae bacterium]
MSDTSAPEIGAETASEGVPVAHAPRIERIGAAKLPVAAVGPSDHTLRWMLSFLAVVAGATALSWGALVGVCNAHPPQSQKFKQASQEKLVARPQDAAFEFHHSLFVEDFERARGLATGAALDIVHDKEKQCDEACRREKASRADKAYTRVVLHRLRGINAWVTAETFFEGRVISESYELRRTDRWQVVRAAPPPPPDLPPPEPAVPEPSTLPAASVNPEPSASAPAALTAEPLATAGAASNSAATSAQSVPSSP